MHWLEMAMEAGLAQLPWSTLLADIGEHCAQSAIQTPRDPWRLRPSLIADPCPLSQAKKMMGHEPQPGIHFDSIRAGKPSGATGQNFIRGFVAEGLVVSCLKRTGYGRVLAHAPSYTLRVDPDLEAHPDVLMDQADGVNDPILVQIKNPNPGMFERIQKGLASGQNAHIMQTAFELYVAQRAGIPVTRAYLFYLTWDPWPAGIKLDSGLQTHVHPVYWTPQAEALVEELITNLRAIRDNAYRGVFPDPDPQTDKNKYPHSYCNFSRYGDHNIPACTDQAAWGVNQIGAA